MQAAKGRLNLLITPTHTPPIEGLQKVAPPSGRGLCTHLLLSEAAGACQLPQPWGDPGKSLKGKRGSECQFVSHGRWGFPPGAESW